MRHTQQVLLLGLLLPALLLAGPVLAQTGVDMSWSALDPGDDWAATVVRSVFPVGGSTGTVSTGNAATVVGTLVRYLTGFVSSIAMVFLIYSLLMQMWRGAETGRLLTDGMSGIFALRLGVAAIFMFPLSSGFSAGQAAVVQFSMWGIGMARTVYSSAVQAIGADARVIADPIIPGTRTIVAGLIRNEFCRALVNAASNNPNLVPVPTPVSAATSGGNTVQTWSYRLSSGNEVGAPVCGSVTLRISAGSYGTIAGVSIDMGAKQREILNAVLENTIRPQTVLAAQQLYSGRRLSAMEPLMGVLVAGTSDYTTRLTSAASQAMSQLRAKMADARGSGANADASQTRLAALGWSSAGAYYLEFSRLNGATLSLMSAVPVLGKPTGHGLGRSLGNDLIPYMQASESFMNRMAAYVATVDQVNTPIGGAALFAGASPAEDGAGLIDRVFRYMNLGETLLGLITNYLVAPGVSVWTDPFGSLMQVGHAMITAGLGALGAAGVAVAASEATTTATGGIPIVGGALGATTAGIGKALEFFSPAIFALASGLLLPGLTIAYVLPMIPFLIWLAGVAGWLILVCEAVIAVPLWMLAHMTMRGEGLHGKATEGYSLIFNVLFRPVLMLLGLFLGYFIFASTSWLLRQGFGVAAGFVLGNGWVVTNVIGVIVLMCIFVLCHVVLALMSFRMISLVPHHVPRLIGFMPANRVDMDGFSRDAALVGAAGALKQIEGAITPKSVGGGVRQAVEHQRSDVENAGDHGSKERNGMDTTMRAATDTGGSAREG
ncbi:DotA/TraY family protein [Muricoccus nepalensis]|nr:DotA/TraY family protein [Roseomonas nepalensis]